MTIYTDNFNVDDYDFSEIIDDPDALEELSDDEKYEIIYEEKDLDYAEARANCNKELDNVIVCFANIGSWNGHHKGFKVMGNNLVNILTRHVSGPYSTLTVEVNDEDVVATEAHHDGTNTYIYRKLRFGIDPDELYDENIDQYEITESLVDYLNIF